MMTSVPHTEAEFAALAEHHRRELHVHCYRMLGSFEEAEDLVQETLLRAWRGRAGLERDDWFRAWLYKIATNACLDAIKRDGRRVPSLGSFRDLPWLQPYPDRLLDEAEAGIAVHVRHALADDVVDIGMYVDPALRRRGVGSSILALTARDVLSQGRTPVAGCWGKNWASRVTLETAGMTCAGTIFRLDLDPDVFAENVSGR